MIKHPKIILIQLFAIGDVLMCEPAIHTLRNLIPEAELTFLTGNGAAPLFELNPAINHLIICHKQLKGGKYLLFLISLLKSRYDYLIDFQKNPRTYLMSFLIRARQKISFRSKRRNLVYHTLLDSFDLNKYVAYEKSSLIHPLLTGNFLPANPRIFINDADRHAANSLYEQLGLAQSDFVIAVSPVSKTVSRRWEAENYARLCDFLYNTYGVRFIFTWGPGEEHQVKQVTELMQSHQPALDYRIDSLRVLYAIFEQADMYLGNDNGPRHLAIAAGIPTMGIFSHAYSGYWTPPEPEKHRFVVPGLSATSGKRRSIADVNYGEVQEVCSNLVQQLLSSRQER